MIITQCSNLLSENSGISQPLSIVIYTNASLLSILLLTLLTGIILQKTAQNGLKSRMSKNFDCNDLSAGTTWFTNHIFMTIMKNITLFVFSSLGLAYIRLNIYDSNAIEIATYITSLVMLIIMILFLLMQKFDQINCVFKYLYKLLSQDSFFTILFLIVVSRIAFSALDNIISAKGGASNISEDSTFFLVLSVFSLVIFLTGILSQCLAYKEFAILLPGFVASFLCTLLFLSPLIVVKKKPSSKSSKSSKRPKNQYEVSEDEVSEDEVSEDEVSDNEKEESYDDGEEEVKSTKSSKSSKSKDSKKSKRKINSLID